MASLYVKLLSGDIIPLSCETPFTIPLLRERIQQSSSELEAYESSQFELFPLEHDEKDVALEDWIPEVGETIGVLVCDKYRFHFQYNGVAQSAQETPFHSYELHIWNDKECGQDDIDRHHIMPFYTSANFHVFFHKDRVQWSEISPGNRLRGRRELLHFENKDDVEEICPICSPVGTYSSLNELLPMGSFPPSLYRPILAELLEAWEREAWLDRIHDQVYDDTHPDMESDQDQEEDEEGQEEDRNRD